MNIATLALSGAFFAACSPAAVHTTAAHHPPKPPAHRQAPPAAHKPTSYEVCLVSTDRLNAAADLCDGFYNDGAGTKVQSTWDRWNKDAGWTPLDNDETPDFDTPTSAPCPDAWAYEDATTFYVCWDGRVTSS